MPARATDRQVLKASRSEPVPSRDPGRVSVFTTILTKGPLSRAEVSRFTGLSQATVTKAVKPLIDHGYVVEEAEQGVGVGRPAIPLSINASRHYVVGIKVARHELIGVVIDMHAEVLASRHHPLRSTRVDSVVAACASLAAELIALDEAFEQRVIGIGVGLGGHVDGSGENVRTSPQLGWRDVPFADLLEEATGLYTAVENDVNTLAVAEQWFGAGQDIPWFAVVTVGAGVGCGLVLGGELAHGATGVAGELGHIVVEPGGLPCRCGKHGCVETIACDEAILTAIAAAGGPTLLDIAEAAAIARDGDAAAMAAFSRAGDALGRGIAALVNLVNPSRIVLSGEGVVASDLLMEALHRAIREHAFSTAAADCEIVTRPLPDETWARGAASMVLRHLFSRPLDRLVGVSAG